MRDLNLGPDSKRLVDKYNYNRGREHPDQALIDAADDMAAMLARWIEVAWCWPDACPSQICGGPHVKVRYDFDKTVEVIEPKNQVGETFPDAKHTVVTTATGLTRRT
jgi:hypothetical protein